MAVFGERLKITQNFITRLTNGAIIKKSLDEFVNIREHHVSAFNFQSDSGVEREFLGRLRKVSSKLSSISRRGELKKFLGTIYGSNCSKL